MTQRPEAQIAFDILSLFPDCFTSYFQTSVLGKAVKCGLIEINHVNIRDYAENKHNRVDDKPYGGGPGMVMMPGPISRAIRSRRGNGTTVIALSPQGKPLTAAKCKELANEKHLVLLCGHYEGIDQRVLDSDVDEEISIGDYVLTNGCLAAMVLVDAIGRFIPGVLGHELGAHEESFEGEGLLEWPQYTKPEEFEGVKVPEVLRSGNHREIDLWRRRQSEERTRKCRPDLLNKKLSYHEENRE